jgi:ribosomal protein S12 methylthiotransferase accessory factor
VALAAFSEHPPCPDCLSLRVASSLQPFERQALTSGEEIYGDSTSYWFDIAEERLLALSRIICGRSRLTGQAMVPVYIVDLFDQSIAVYPLFPEELCLSCSPRRSDKPELISLNPPNDREVSEGIRMKGVFDYGIEPDYFINPRLGRLGRSAKFELQNGVTAPVVGAFFDRVYHHKEVHWGGHGTSYGKSLLTGLLEGLERYAGLEPLRVQPIVRGSFLELADTALDPQSCGLYPPACYGRSSSISPYDPNQPISWLWGYSLTRHTPVLVPQQMAFYGALPPGELRFVTHNSSGASIGASLAEAVLHALFELIERDSFMISWMSSLSLRRIDPYSCRNPDTQHLLNRLHYHGWDMSLLDARLDIRIPTIICIGRRHDVQFGSLLLAAACDIDPDMAVQKALREVASFSSGFHGDRDKQEARARELMADFSLVRDIGDHSLLYGLPEMAEKLASFYLTGEMRSFESTYREESLRFVGGISNYVEICLSHLASANLKEIIVVDQTPPIQSRFGLNTCCLIIPGMIPMDFGYGKHRISTLPRFCSAPPTAGYRKPSMESLNPLPHPFP